MPENIGLQVSEVYTRISSTDGFSVSYTPAYDSNDNNTDFVNRNPLDLAPRNSLTALGTTISGTPAEGAMVSCSDGLSISTTSYLVGNPPYAEFNLIDVATGTWTVSITSSQYSLVDDTVTIVSTGDIYAFPSTSTFFNTAITWGYVTGKVTDIFIIP